MKMKAIPFAMMTVMMILGCQNTTTQSQERNMDGGEKAMTARNETTSKMTKPPIDLAAARTETATFALG
jgi:hypothetical protein